MKQDLQKKIITKIYIFARKNDNTMYGLKKQIGSWA